MRSDRASQWAQRRPFGPETRGRLGPRAWPATLTILLLFSALFWALPVGARKGDKAEIDSLEVTREGEALFVSFHLENAFEQKTIDRIESGLPTGFIYDLKLERMRRWWWDRNVQTSKLEVVGMYNAITREYLVNYKQDGDLINSRVVTTLQELEAAMTMFHTWPAFKLEDRPQGRLIVRLRAELGSKTILAFIPTTIHTDWAESVFRLSGELIEKAATD